MKRTIAIDPILAGVIILVLNGCVPVGPTITEVDKQSEDAARGLQDERAKSRQLLKEKNQLKAQLADLKAKRKSLEASDPVGNRSEIESLNHDIAKLEHQLKTML